MTNPDGGKFPLYETPKANFARGLLSVDTIPGHPQMGAPMRGKVRDSWVFQQDGTAYRLMVTTDRLSAYDRVICTVPGKGAVLNLLSAYWFRETQDIIPNHVVAVPHPNILIARQAEETLPVEMVFRRFMAKSATSTSVYRNYIEGKRDIYGIHFPDGLRANEEFPMGSILTPTTKAEAGHDQMLTSEQARAIVDGKFGWGLWDKAALTGYALFERGSEHCAKQGLILADTKYEFGIIDGQLALIDEVHTPDSSRFWLADTYEERFEQGQNPETFDKEIIRRWLKEQGFEGEGPVPVVNSTIIDQVSTAYRVPYEMITGKTLPQEAGLDAILLATKIHDACSQSVTVYVYGKA